MLVGVIDLKVGQYEKCVWDLNGSVAPKQLLLIFLHVVIAKFSKNGCSTLLNNPVEFWKCYL